MASCALAMGDLVGVLFELVRLLPDVNATIEVCVLVGETKDRFCDMFIILISSLNGNVIRRQ